MAGRYTQDEFLKAVEDSGLRGQWSDADWQWALEDPDWGMSMLSGKIRYNNATTQEERDAAHQWNEENRRMKGYSGGGDGSYYHLIPTPASFEYEAAPTFESSVSGDVQDLWDKQKNYADFNYLPAPEYTNRYDGRINSQLGRIENYGPFAYDAATDPLYSQYRKQYAREGRRATEDMLASASAASGGMPSSYAYTAAAQQGNYYASQMTDKIPELYQLAYNKYLSDFQLENSKLSALQGAEQSDWAKYLTQLGQHNTDQKFRYDIYSDKYNRIANDLQTALGMEDTDWSRYLDQVNQHNIEQNFKYNQFTDELAKQQQEQQDKWNQAAIAHDIGDNSFYNDLGINTDNDPAEWERRRQEQQDARAWADTAGGWGDYGLLNEQGVNPNAANVNDMGLAARGEYNKTTGLTEQQIMQLQYYLGVTMDGWWGPESMAAAGGMTADEAYQAMLNDELPKGVGGGGYSGGGDDYDYSGYIPEPGNGSDFDPYANAGKEAGSGNLVTGNEYIPGAADRKSGQEQATGGKTGSKPGSKTATGQTASSTNTQKANDAGLSVLATEIAKQKVQGNQAEAEQIAKDAVADGLIDQQTANSLVGKKIYKSTK